MGLRSYGAGAWDAPVGVLSEDKLASRLIRIRSKYFHTFQYQGVYCFKNGCKRHEYLHTLQDQDVYSFRNGLKAGFSLKGDLLLRSLTVDLALEPKGALRSIWL